MKVLTMFLSVSFLTCVKSDIPEFLKNDLFNIYQHIAIDVRTLQNHPVTSDKVTYYLFTRSNPNQHVNLDTSNVGMLANGGSKVVFFIHGWIDNRDSRWYEDLKNAFLTKYPDYYVVQVDWRDPASQLYPVSSINTYDVAEIIANLIVDLHKNYNFNLNRIVLVGHSLGGHIAGFVGKNVYRSTGKKLPRIVALDPAGPTFVERPDDKRLNKGDAEVVEVIHTDGGTFGLQNACGTIDFFPNGGSSQPGCKKIDLLDVTSLANPVVCDHLRACGYFAEAVSNPDDFTAKQCTDWQTFKENGCGSGGTVSMGDLTTRATGNFYLETNGDKPFGRKMKSSFRFGMLNINV